MFKVLITASGTGSRLGNLTNHFNKSLIRIGKKPAITHIIESYPKETNFVTTLGYKGDYVKQYLTLAHPDINFEYVYVDPFEGEGSSLLYSMSCAKENLQEPFIFHACDTILSEKIEPTNSFIVTSNKEDCSQYRCFNEIACKIEDKNVYSKNPYIGVCGITDYKNFWSITEEILNESNSMSLSDVDVLNRLTLKDFDIIKHDYWYDIGNENSLKETRENHPDKFHILDKEDESIYIFEKYVVKFFANKVICKNRIDRVKVLGSLVPRLLDYSDNFYKYEFVPGDEFSNCVNGNNIEDLFNLCFNKLWVDTGVNIKEKCLEFYKKKTLDRLNSFYFKYDIEDKEEIINGHLVPKLSDLLSCVDFESLCDVTASGFHGDFILENIIYDNKFTLIDWRQDFAGDISLGDMYYDLAKFNHNLTVVHDLIYQDKFDLKLSDEISVSIDSFKDYENLKTKYFEILKEHSIDLKKVNILTCIIWLNMSALHEEKFSKFLYYFGKLNLFEVVNEIKHRI